jgi:hypothetical protein
MKWESQAWVNPRPGYRIDDVAFSGDTLVAAYQPGLVLRKDSWADEPKYFDLQLAPNLIKLRCLAFVGDGEVGYLGLLRTDQDADLIPRLWVTPDGGKNWEPNDPRDRNGKAVGPWHGFCGLSAVDDVVWAVGTYQGVGKYFEHEHIAAAIVSDDGGKSWISRFTGANSLIDVHFATREYGLIVGENTEHRPAVWTTKNGGVCWEKVDLPNADLQGRCWKIARDGFRVAITVDSDTPETRLLLADDFRDPLSWRSFPVDYAPGQIHDSKLAGIAWLNGTHWIGVYKKGTRESTDLSDPANWPETVLSNGGGTLNNVNRIIRGPDGCLYAAGENLYRYA